MELYPLFFILIIGLVEAQDIQDTINSIFNTSFLTDYEEVTQEPLRSLSALKQCGEADDVGRAVCVPYFNCDPTTQTVIRTGTTDGFGQIDIRYSKDDKCEDLLDVCCKISEGDETLTTPSSTDENITSRPVVPSRPDPIPNENSNGGSNTINTGNKPQTTDLVCGIRNPQGIDFQILYNTHNEAEYGEFPWMVAVLRSRVNTAAGEHQCLCGGSLIASNVVLTGAHCVESLQAADLKIRAGEWDTQTKKERIPYQERNVAKIIKHESYGAGASRNDIALLLLSQSLTKVESIGTVCLPKHNQRSTSRHCFASGWGKLDFGKEGVYSVILKKIELPMVQSTDCQRALRRTRLGPSFRLHNSFICAGGEAGKDTCTGDGGSPLVCPDPDNPSRYVQVGIVSWGIGCAQNNTPGVYTDVTKFRNWIDQKLQAESIDINQYIV